MLQATRPVWSAQYLRTGALVLVAALIGLYLYTYAPSFFKLNNAVNILVQASILGVLAIGMTYVLVSGGIDLSLPANMALASVLGGLYVQGGGSIVVGCFIMVAAATALGTMNGIAVAYLRMIPFVVTLATMTLASGAAVWLSESVSITGFPESFFDVLLARVGGVPLSVYVLGALTLISSLIFSSTIFGRWLYAIGINTRAAQVARVPIGLVTWLSYAVAGLMAGITAILLTARLGSASANMGSDSVVLDIVSACVVGGVSIYGGVGRPLGAVLGAIFITALSNSLNLLGVSFYFSLIVKGCVIIGFISLDNLARQPR
ncbi:MAG: ABC transporter permease [Rhizobiales bacterium]|nr:ABC transporter permease [Hyphomicrobiales bacterium]